MKILFYAHSSSLYGANRSLMDLITGLSEISENFQARVVIPQPGPIVEKLKSEEIDYKIIPHYSWFYHGEYFEVKRKRSVILAKAWKLKYAFQKRLLNKMYFSRHLNHAKDFEPDYIYVNSSLAPMGLLVADKLNRKVVWHHREVVNDDKTQFYLDDNDRFRKIFNDCAFHIYLSKFLLHRYKDLPTVGKSHVVYNGLDLSSFDETSMKKFSEKRNFGIVGRINKQKNQEEVINLFRNPELDQLSLTIVGGDENQILKYSREQDKNIKFEIFQSDFRFYEKFDVLIVNALHEAFGRTIIEANHFGIPVLARASGALPELVQDGINGWLFKDAAELKQKIFDVSNLTAEDFTAVSKSSKEYSRRFSNKVAANKVLNLLAV